MTVKLVRGFQDIARPLLFPFETFYQVKSSQLGVEMRPPLKPTVLRRSPAGGGYVDCVEICIFSEMAAD